jgi:hypothetical protein
MSSSNTNNINPRPCVYGCGIQIYWNASVNEYWEVLTKKRHICPNIVSNKNKTSITPPSNAPKPYYYNSTKKASFSSANPKPKMSNSFELLQGPIETIQKKYEILSDIVSENNGKVHGSQSHMISNNSMSLIVYYEVPQGQRDEVINKLNNSIVTKLNNNKCYYYCLFIVNRY